MGAERQLRKGYEELERIGETGYLSSVAGILAEAVRMQGRLDEALECPGERADRRARRLRVAGGWRCVCARIFAVQGEVAEAERLAREAVAMLEPTDALSGKSQGALALADVLCIAGRPRESVPLLEDAIRFSEDKGDSVTAVKAREKLDRALSYA